MLIRTHGHGTAIALVFPAIVENIGKEEHIVPADRLLDCYFTFSGIIAIHIDTDTIIIAGKAGNIDEIGLGFNILLAPLDQMVVYLRRKSRVELMRYHGNRSDRVQHCVAIDPVSVVGEIKVHHIPSLVLDRIIISMAL